MAAHEPILVRGKDDGTYEIISGHNRMKIATLLGIETLPCRKANKKVTDEIADGIMVATNLNRKNTFSHSELAKSITILRESRKRQGYRSDLEESKEGCIEEEFGMSTPQIRRYLRIAKLTPDLLEMIDEKALTVRSGVELSYISHEHQLKLLEIIQKNSLSVSYENSQKIRDMTKDEAQFNEETIIELLKPKENTEKTKKKMYQ
ncbi:MAG: ParB/RepB/Spo0J family partition protein [Oscillospiraceae bacterium]|nr:ParB/RepB/Spo0J family partition protein [Oscillospiraceae bacterium]